MKHFILIILLLFTGLSYVAQIDKKAKRIEDKKDSALAREKRFLISDTAFNKMIVKDISYAIFGESSPASGIKIDLSKPEATISGVIPRKDKFVFYGFEFKGGITDRNFVIFKGFNDFNTKFEFKPTMYIIPKWNSATFNNDTKKKLARAEILHQKRLSESKIDTFKIAALIYNHHFTNFPSFQDPQAMDPAKIQNPEKKILIHLLGKILSPTNSKLVITNSVNTILNELPVAKKQNGSSEIEVDDKFKPSVVSIYNKYKKLNKTRSDDLFNKEIELARPVWKRKRLGWISISPSISTEKINAFHTTYRNSSDSLIDSTYFKKQYPLFVGVDLTYNRLIHKIGRRMHYFRLGLNFSHANNLNTLSSFNYETRSPLFAQNTNSTEKTESGTAFNSSDIRKGFRGQVHFSYFLLPLKSFYPGLFVSSDISVSSLYNLPKIQGREKDAGLMSAEAGVIFNVNNREKGKETNLLSVSLYGRFEDLTDTRRTVISTMERESSEDYYKRNLSFGIRVGIPITLPKSE